MSTWQFSVLIRTVIAGGEQSKGSIMGRSIDYTSIILTDQRGEELRGRAPSCHKGCTSYILTEMEVLEDEQTTFNATSVTDAATKLVSGTSAGHTSDNFSSDGTK